MRFSESDAAALTIIDRVDVKSIESMKLEGGGALTVVANWDVYGSIYHSQHVHYRCNTYRAEVTLVPADRYWKMSRIQLMDQQRVL